MKMLEPKDMALAKCPSCGEHTLKSHAGCHECINPECGYGVCD